MKGSLTEAIKELSPAEKSSLVSRIQAQLVTDDASSVQEGDIKGLSSAQTPLKDIQENLERDLKGEAFWRKLLLRVLSTFSSRPFWEIYRDDLLYRLISASEGGSLKSFIDFSEKRVKGSVFRKVNSIYQQAQGLNSFFSYSSVQEEGLASVVYELLKGKVLNPKENLSDFLSEEEILNIFKKGQKTDTDIKEILKGRIKIYLEGIHPQMFDEIQTKLQSFTLARLMVLFPYPTLLDPFLGGNSLSSKTEEEINELAREGTSFNAFSRPFEKFAQLLQAFSVVVLDFSIFNRVFELYYKKVLSHPEGGISVSEEAFREDLKGKLINFYNNLKVFQKTIPLTTFIKVLKQDPYYSMDSSSEIEGPMIFDFYQKMLEASLFSEWKSSRQEITKKYWSQEVKSFLSSEAVTAIEEAPFPYRDQESGKLASWGEIQLLHFFLEKYGDSLFSYFLKTLMHVALVNKPTYRNEVEVLEASLNEFSKIERLTSSSFTKERREIIKKLELTDISLQDKKNIFSRWLTTTEQHNRKVLEDFYDFFKRLRACFVSLQKASELSSVMNISYSLDGKKITINDALGLCNATIDKYLDLVEDVSYSKGEEG